MLSRYAIVVLGAVVLAAASRVAHAGAHLSRAEGVVEVLHASGGPWTIARGLEVLDDGDRVRTGVGAAAQLSFDDGSRLELGPDASLLVQEASEAAGPRVRIELGLLRASVAPKAAGRFELRTPSALCRGRGSAAQSLEVRVLAGGRTLIELFGGLLAVEDNLGNQTLLRAEERLQVDVRGLRTAERRLSREVAASAGLRALARAEAGLDAAEERARASPSREARLGELQQGRALMDLNGNRVRVERFVSRPSAASYRLVVLNERSRRLDWFYYQGAFNKALPADLAPVVAQLPGCVDRPCDWYLTEFSAVRGNMVDTIAERGVNTLGGQVDVNSNGDAGDNVSSLFDPSRDAYVDVTGRSVFQTIINQYGFYVNGRLKHGWSGPNITSYADKTPASTLDPFTGQALGAADAWFDPATGALAAYSRVETFPSSGQQVEYRYNDGSYLRWDNYSIDDAGGIARIGSLGGAALLDRNYEQVLTSSHFGGRRIDMLVAPNVLLQAGLHEALLR